MAEQLLHGADVVAVFKEMRGKGVKVQVDCHLHSVDAGGYSIER